MYASRAPAKKAVLMKATPKKANRTAIPGTTTSAPLASR